MKNDFELFEGKTMSSLFQDIYVNQTKKKRKISDLMDDIKVLIKKPSDLESVGITLADLLQTSVKNDEQLLKLAQIAQKIMAADNKDDGDDGFLTAAEKEQLLKDVKDSEVTTDEVEEIQHTIDKLKKASD